MYFVTDTTWTQSYIFISLLFVGTVMGSVYVFIDGIKQHVKKKIWKNVHDVIFCLILFFTVSTALYVVGTGKIHLYMVVALIMGFFISKSVFDNLVKTSINKVIQLIKSIKVRLNKFKK